MTERLRVIAFDADDTLWENETLFREAERKWAEILKDYGSLQELSQVLYAREVENMEDLGFGAKAFAISLMETTVQVTAGAVTGGQVQEILSISRELLHNPATPLPRVVETLETLRAVEGLNLVLLTKGDLLDQEHKIARSGLAPYFDHIEIVSDKNRGTYASLVAKFGVSPEEFMMVGNSFKSDIAPVLEIGGWGAHIPFHVLWQLEHAEEYDHPRLFRLANISELPGIINTMI